MASKLTFRLYTLVISCVLSAFLMQAGAQGDPDSIPGRRDSSRYPLQDRYGDPYTQPNRNSLDLKDTGFVRRNIEYDPVTRQYYVIEKIGNRTVINVSLSDNDDQLSDVVVVGYGSRRKETLTGSVSNISNKDIQTTTNVSLVQKLQGKRYVDEFGI